MNGQQLQTIRQLHEELQRTQSALVQASLKIDDKKEMKLAEVELHHVNRLIAELFRVGNYYRIKNNS